MDQAVGAVDLPVFNITQDSTAIAIYGQRRTLHDHLPPDKVHFLMQTPVWCQTRAAEIGPTCAAVIAAVLGDRPLDRLRSAQGILRLAQRYGAPRPPNRIRPSSVRER